MGQEISERRKKPSSSLAALGNLRAVVIMLLNKPQFSSIRQCAGPDQRIPSLSARPVAHLELEGPVCQNGWRSAADEEATMARGSKVFRPDDVSESNASSYPEPFRDGQRKRYTRALEIMQGSRITASTLFGFSPVVSHRRDTLIPGRTSSFTWLRA